MKINLIPTYQQGGVYSPPYAVYQPLPVAAQTNRAAPASASSDSKDLTDEDTLKMLDKLDGLPSDMTIITRQLQNFHINQAHTRGGASSSASSVTVRYLGILNQLKIANFNKKEYDNAYSQVSKNGGINEFAVNERGQFICVNKDGDFKLMTAEELKKDSGGYSPLTNSELLYHRANDIELANNNQLLSVVQNGIGMEVVTKMVQDALDNLGSMEDIKEGYVSTKQGRLIQGVQDFNKAVQEAAGTVTYDGTINDLYKYKFLSKDQAENARDAFSYIYSTLPANAKALLKAKSDLTEEGAQKLVQTLIASKLDTKQQFGIEMIGGVSTKTSKEANANGNAKDDSKLKNTQLVQMVQDTGGVRQPMLIDKGNGIQMSVYGRQFNLIVGMDGKPIETTSISDMMSQSGIQGIVKNMKNITFGDQKVSPEALQNITYNNTGVMRTILPINEDGTVNLSLLDAFEQAEADLDSLGREPTNEERQAAFEKVGITDLLNADGSLKQNKFGVFLVTEGYTTDKLSGLKPSPFVQEYAGDTDRAIDIIQSSLSTGTGKDKKGPKVDAFEWYNPGDWFSYYDRIYKAAIYIPIDNSINAAALYDRQNLNYSEGLVHEGQYQNEEKRVNMQPTSAEALNNNS